MFLNKLNVLEKKAFISLSVHAAKANDKITESESEMIEEYCKEMGISFFDINSICSIDEIITIYKDSEPVSKNIVLLESLGLLYADGLYDEKERNFIKDFACKIGLPESTVEKYEKLIESYMKLLKTIAEEVFEQ